MYLSRIRFFQLYKKRKQKRILLSFVFALMLPQLSVWVGISPTEFTHAHLHIYLNEPDFDHHSNKAHNHKNQEQNESPSQVFLLLENQANNQLFLLTIPHIHQLRLLQNKDDHPVAKMELLVLSVQLIYLPMAKKPPRFTFLANYPAQLF
jgi:hypothetical protein